MSFRLWVDLFPVAWSSFTIEEQKALTAGLSKLLASDIHGIQQNVSSHALWEELDKDYKQWGASTSHPFAFQANSCYGTIPVTNGLQAVLEAVLRCSPQPRLPPTLLLHLTKTYGCGPQASLLLEAGLREATDTAEKKAYRQCLKAAFVSVQRVSDV